MRPRRIAQAVLFSLSCLAAAAVPAADRFDDIRAYIREQLVEQSVPSVAVAVARHDEILWEEGFGWADLERRAPATEHTVYSLASISKPITATGLMTLVQAGLVDLDRPANDYLGNAKLQTHIGDIRAATVRRVANHTSGLPSHVQFFYADQPYRRPSMDETILRYGHLMTVPGEEVGYSNLGYGVLDYIIERVSGMSYPEFMRRKVFRPLGMTRTSVNIGPGLEAHAATRYDSDGLPLAFYDFDHPGASAVFSSAHDLIRFAQFHLKAHLPDQQAILSDASIDEMHRRTADYRRDFGFSVGFAVLDEGRYRRVQHDGSMGGVSTQMMLFPEQQLAVVALSNSVSPLPSDVVERIAAKLLPRWQPAKAEEFELPPFVAPRELLGTWKGALATYARDLPVQLRFLPGGNVQAKFGDQLETLISRARIKDGVFRGELAANVGTPDTERCASKTVQLALRLRGDVLNGGASSYGVDGARACYFLTHWLEVKRTESAR